MDTRANSQARLGRIGSLGAALALAGLIAGCSVAAASPSALIGKSPAPTGPDASTSPSASPPASVVPSASISASIAPAPSGVWTGINWVAEGKAFPQEVEPFMAGKHLQTSVSVFGWSGGYLGFRLSYDELAAGITQDTSMISTASPDGVHWTAVRSMDLKGLAMEVVVSQVMEGPHGLLAVGHYPAAACGGPITVDALWSSPDGQIWTRVAPPSDFASARIYTVDGGSIGFIATGTLKDGVTQAIWISADGRIWTRGAVPTVTTGTFSLNGATAFASGYVVAGTILGDEGCGGPGMSAPSLWWSATGTSWTRAKLPGATPAKSATVTLTRIDDHTVMAVVMDWSESGTGTETVWVSPNGKDWTLAKNPSTQLQFHVISNGQRTLIVPSPTEDKSAPPIQEVGDDASITTLPQTGSVPGIDSSAPSWTYAIGPTGILCVASDGSGLWLGAPAA